MTHFSAYYYFLSKYTRQNGIFANRLLFLFLSFFIFLFKAKTFQTLVNQICHFFCICKEVHTIFIKLYLKNNYKRYWDSHSNQKKNRRRMDCKGLSLYRIVTNTRGSNGNLSGLKFVRLWIFMAQLSILGHFRPKNNRNALISYVWQSSRLLIMYLQLKIVDGMWIGMIFYGMEWKEYKRRVRKRWSEVQIFVRLLFFEKSGGTYWIIIIILFKRMWRVVCLVL